VTLGDVTEKGSMVSKMPCPPCRPFHPIGEAGLWMSAIWIQGGGAPLSWGGAHQTLFLFPERGLRESGTAAWAHYPRADSGLLGRCDTDVTVTARGTEFDWMLHNLLWCILGTQARTRGRARSVQAPPARSLAPRAPLYASREKRRRLHTTTSTTQAFHSQFWDYQHRPLLTYTNSPSLSNRTATALGTPGARTAPARAALGTPGERWTPARAAQMSKASHHSWTATGPRECNIFSGPA